MKQNQNRTGGGEYEGSLTEMEKRLLGVLGWVSVLGCEDLPPEIDPEELTEQENIFDCEVEEIHNYALPHDGESTVFDQVDVPSKHQSEPESGEDLCKACNCSLFAL